MKEIQVKSKNEKRKMKNGNLVDKQAKKY